MDIENIEEFIVIDKRIDTAEDQAVDVVRESLRDRWEFGRLMLAMRVGKQLPKGMLDALAEETGKSRAELKFRAQFAERYPTEDEVATAVATFTSWNEARASLPKPRPTPTEGKSPIASVPKASKKRGEMVDLAEQGKTRKEIAAATGTTESTVRKEMEREAIAQQAREDAAILTWTDASGTVQQKLDRAQRQIREQIEAEIQPRVSAELQRLFELTAKSYRDLKAKTDRILDGRKGVFTKRESDLIRTCLHPDSRLSVSDDKLAQAFRVFNEAEILLLDERGDPTPRMTMPTELKRKKAR